jgi:hypothetical protein
MIDELLTFRKSGHEFIQKEFRPRHARCCQPHRPIAEAGTTAGRIGILIAGDHAGQGYMTENPIACMRIDTRVEQIQAGANEIMMEMTGSSR